MRALKILLAFRRLGLWIAAEVAEVDDFSRFLEMFAKINRKNIRAYNKKLHASNKKLQYYVFSTSLDSDRIEPLV